MPSTYQSQQQYPMNQNHQLKQFTLSAVEPVVQYGLNEAQTTSLPHAMREVAAISYLMGQGYNAQVARQVVESWEVNEMFYR
ncbi:hypothetical protein JR050_05865 [Bacillus sp. RD4P76]|uniref:Uncharacterized protein n=2 Tax=Bacillus suaedaesalsae TaxID=2810349 RepID=A0ABS2DFG5_9BACI|nr:hypothetical protein [Bacillus suaedaesalsae]